MLKILHTLLLLIPLSAFAQLNIINRSLTDSSLNIAYIGVENAIELTERKNNHRTISFSATNGTITNVGENRYVLRPLKPGECVITFTEKNKVLAKKAFFIDNVPEPGPRFSNVNDSIQKGDTKYLKISLSRLVNDPVLRIYAPKCFLKEKGQILSYRITYDGPGFEDQDEILVTGSRLSEDQVKLISKRFRNDTYMFVDEIRCVFPDGRIYRLVPLFYIVTK